MHFQNVPTAVSKDTAAGVLFLNNAGFATDFKTASQLHWQLMLRKVLVDCLEIPFSKAAKLALLRFSQCLPERLSSSHLWSKNNRYAISKSL